MDLGDLFLRYTTDATTEFMFGESTQSLSRPESFQTPPDGGISRLSNRGRATLPSRQLRKICATTWILPGDRAGAYICGCTHGQSEQTKRTAKAIAQ